VGTAALGYPVECSSTASPPRGKLLHHALLNCFPPHAPLL